MRYVSRGVALLALITMIGLSMSCGDDSPTTPNNTNNTPPAKATVAVDASPDQLTCPWALTGPGGYSHNGSGDETIADLEPGDYTLTWGAVSGWTSPTPASETKSVAAGATATFSGTYVQQAGSIVVNAEPNAANATWTLTGPGGYNHNGSGDETIADLDPGDYTITWNAVSGYELPSPASETQTLAAGGSLTFTGTYSQQPGSIVVNAEPDAANATWALTGPGGYSYNGQGDETRSGLAPGSYTITWNAVSGYDLPSPATETQTLAAGGSVTFTGTYTAQAQTGTIEIASLPAGLDGPWTLNGPGGYTTTGTGTTTLTNQPVGMYTIQWGTVPGYHTPQDLTQPLGADQTIYFTGQYYLFVGRVNVDAEPNIINAPWSLTGPNGFSVSNTGDQSYVDRPVGDYTITWEPVSGYVTPDPATETLTLAEGNLDITFTGTYLPEPQTPVEVFIAGGKFEMGSPASELGRYANETLHWVELSSFYMSTLEITQSQYGSLTPSYTVWFPDAAVHNVSWVDAVAYCNALSVQEGLTPVYTINGSDVTWNQAANGYRLPTEAEWEYACRAGTSTAFANGDITDVDCADPVLDEIGWYCGNSQTGAQRNVGNKIANAWGLHDMHGNVWEYCWDWWGDYGTGTFDNPDVNPTGPATGTLRIRRGGDTTTTAKICRSAFRYASTGSAGIRVVRNAP